MIRARALLAAALLWFAAAPAFAQSSPGWTYGFVPTVGQWNDEFASKQDYLGAPPLLTTGGTMTGELVTAPSTSTNAGFNIAPGAAPSSPLNGDMWVTSGGVFVQINGSTVGPLIAAASPCTGCALTANPLSQFAATTSAQFASVISNETGTGLVVFNAGPSLSAVTVTGSFTATGLVTNADLVNQSTTVNGQTCTLGSTCTITASAGTITVGVTTVASATNGNILFNNAGTLGQYGITGTAGNVVLSASPTLTGTITAASLTMSGSLTIGATVENFPASGNIVGTTDTQSLTNKTISGSSNTLTNIANASLVNSTVNVNGTVCTLGSSCTPNAGPIVIGTTVITSGTTTKVLFDNAGLVGEYTISGSGNVAMTTSPTFVTPTLGAATGTSLALGGATIGSNALAVTGTTSFSGAMTVTTSSASALAVGLNGATNPALLVDDSTALSATGFTVKSAAAGGGVGLTVISSGTNESATINGKGTGTVTIGAGGLIVSGTVFTATGLVTYADMASGAIATASNYFSGASNVLVPASVIYQSETTTTFGATTTFDFNTFINTAVTLTGNITTMTLNNVKAGQSGQIRFIQDSSGSRTTVWNSIFKFAGGTTPTLSGAANAIDVLFYSCASGSLCYASLVQNMK